MISRYVFPVVLLLALIAVVAVGQAGRHSAPPTGEHGAILSIFASREDGSNRAITEKELALYDDGIEQKIQSLSPDPTPARIVLLVDNSRSLRTDVPKLARVAREFAYEIFEGDQLLIVGYDEQPEIISDWTDDAKKIEASLSSLRKRGEPHLFDALSAVVDQALLPVAGTGHKRVIVLIGDGLDRGSKTKFDSVLAELQSQDITIYALQIPDRTGGALRRDQPKPAEVVRQLAEGTGGRILPLDDPRAVARSICDELRKNRYLLGYTPTNVSYLSPRRLLVLGDSGINVRAKAIEPAK
jgi:Ca-activated chloride channel homolog